MISLKHFYTLLLIVLFTLPSVTFGASGVITPESAHLRYGTEPLRIMIVPGHDNEYSGTAFEGYREADLNLTVAKELYTYFLQDPHFVPLTTRDFTTGEYAIPFQNYFEFNKQEILDFAEEQKSITDRRIADGTLVNKETNNHLIANDDVRLRLYGINKWANHNAVAIVIHIHFNDSPDRKWNARGTYSGFSIYIPESQFPNAELSREIGEVLKERLNAFIPKSDHHLETDTLIETQELIAIGSNGSRDGASLLVEYSYMYEPKIMQPQTRTLLVSEMAYQTYQSIVSYFDTTTPVSTTLLPHYFAKKLKRGLKYNTDVLRLQKALALEGLYPPRGTTLEDCPMNGTFLSCTERAVIAFQNKHRSTILTPLNLRYGTGFVGASTLKQLNLLYGP